ncbi:MAG: DUF4399 domain-containing protein [Gammaproteobacteria bacterium]|jgi:hypothetical protein|nr:DUF4399 domain-containing protein [Gammaproteobacteria bacterium]MDP6617636.1 DUF4399 domain-containing protein [Gammaproteobacteria bacterium]MDP6694513.1 DUF4399 domain-containing protein [Gammaproteobacteria bacterium]
MNFRTVFPIIAGIAFLSACSGGNDDQRRPEVTPATETPASEPARVFFISPENGATVTSPVTVAFGIEGFAVAPAGTYEVGTGHHHLLIDTDLPALDQPVPSDENHLHFGKAQTEAQVELGPGEHTLQMLLGDGNHVPHNPPLISEAITITVTVE